VRVRARVLVTLVSLALLAGFAVLAVDRIRHGRLPIPGLNRNCTVYEASQDRGGRTVRLSSEQMANAATIAAVGIRRNLPERAIVVALATAFQESGLENLPYGDRDSVGLFQQRPSQGWGTVEQIMDPRYAAEQFYTALEKVRGWEMLRVTEAAQAVQRSAFPEAYEKWADDAAVLAGALVGRTSGAVACSVTAKPAIRGSAAATALIEQFHLDWGHLKTVTPGDLLGVAVPVTDAQAGWRYAHWLVSHADDHGVKRVRFGDLEWTAAAGSWSRTAEAGMDLVIAEVFE
jgi:hypothetical protein